MRKPRKGDLVMVNYYKGATAYRVVDTSYENGWLILRHTDPEQDSLRNHNEFYWPVNGSRVTTLACI